MVIDNPYQDYNPPKWWEKHDSKLSYSKYRVNQTDVYVGTRPNIHGMSEKFYQSIDSFINVSDNFVEHEKGKVIAFHPFVEAGAPTIETVYSVLTLLNYQINTLKLSSIYIHCDLGLHRAPTVFGLYVFTYHSGSMRKIFNTHQEVGREIWRTPRLYVHDYLKSRRNVPYFFALLRNLKRLSKTETSLENILKNNLLKRNNGIFFLERASNHSFQQAWFTLWSDLYNGARYLIRTPYIKALIYIHKKLNTKRGQFYKKNNF